MVAKKKALGRGLGALIEESPRAEEPKQNDAIKEIPISQIKVNPFQPRTEFDEEALADLAASIKELGIIQPITVRKVADNEYQIISGERRTRASKMAGLETIPAYVRTADDQGMLEMALVENIQREDLDAIEIAISYNRLIDECSLTQKELSARVGKQRSTITNYLRLLKLPAEIQKGIRHKVISMGHARALISIENQDDQLYLFEMIMKEGLSVRKVEELAKGIAEGENIKETTSTPKTPKAELGEGFKELQNQLDTFFQTGVKLKRTNNGKGQIVIPFKSDDDLERIIGLLDQIKNA
ncbi:MAG: chromosome partitioning protein ParB [Salinivirgaceae bacterium]|nr:MAG: chromosome partitioning protein ParB [Salinivirgaceae bacterium]